MYSPKAKETESSSSISGSIPLQIFNFHTYSILRNPQHIIFSVDGTPIREFKNSESVGVPYPKNQAMRIYSSLWNADDWTTQGGRVKTDWSRAPFRACIWFSSVGSSSCHSKSNSNAPPSTSSSWPNEELNKDRLNWVQKNYMIYNYCTDHNRFPQGLPPECAIHTSS